MEDVVYQVSDQPAGQMPRLGLLGVRKQEGR